MTSDDAAEAAGPALVVRAVGRRALLAEVADVRAAQAVYAEVRALVATGALPGPRDLVPAARTVLLDGLTDIDDWRAALERMSPGLAPDGSDAPGHAASGSGAGETDHVVPVRYDGDDLGVVADVWRCSVDEVVRRHQHTMFTVAFCGFAPGFAYCTPVLRDEERWPMVPRRPEPRTRVPAGAVALAGEYCGVYPSQMPGGWQLVGHTDVVLFDAGREQPALLAPGDRVRFEARP